MLVPAGNCHLSGLAALSDRYMPPRSMAAVPVFFSSIQSSASPCGSRTVVLLDAISSLMKSVVGVVPTSTTGVDVAALNV